MRSALIKRLLADRRVLRMEAAFAGFNLVEYGVWVSVLVYAYERGGTPVAASVAVAQLVPAGLLAPLLARAVDRQGAARSLRRGYWWQAGSLAATSALLLSGAPDPLVYAASIASAIAVTVTRPAQAALAPLLVERPEQLTAINVLSGWVESISVLVGPALAGALIAIDGPGAAVGFFAACVTASALLARGLLGVWGAPAPGARLETGDPPADAVPAAGADLRGGWTAVREDAGLGALISMLGAQYVVIGALDVLEVVLAIDVLGLGASGPGYLGAAFGAGGLIGALCAVRLIGHRRLAEPMLAAAILWGAVLVVLGAWPTVGAAFLLLAAAGTARSVLDVSGRTILIRAAPPAVRGRVFGLLEGAAMLGLALGSALVPVAALIGGAGTGLLATGLLITVIALGAAGRLHAVDRATAGASELSEAGRSRRRSSSAPRRPARPRAAAAAARSGSS